MSTTHSIRIVGGVLPPSLIGHLQDGTLGSAESRSAKSYHLVGSESVRDGAPRAWSYLRGAWSAWHDADQGRVEGSAGTGPARERWLLPLLRELGYGQVPAAAHGLTIDGTDYPVSHIWQHVPVHLLGPGVNLDKRNPGVAGAARAPQAIAQELLNRTDQHLWAILSNGTRLRLLRDSTALVGSAYVEFDLEAIFDGELYAEWLILFQLAHVSRLEVRSEEHGPASCWLETWRGEATDTGARALGRLETGVERALGALGTGFLGHAANRWLLDALRSGALSRHDYHRALLRLVYRLLFTFVAEDRDLLLDPATTAQSRERYTAYFSTARLRRLSRVRAGGPHGDLWHTQRVVLKALGTDGLADLALTALGGVFSPDPRQTVPAGATDQLDLLWGAEIANADLLSAVAHLAWIEVAAGRTDSGTSAPPCLGGVAAHERGGPAGDRRPAAAAPAARALRTARNGQDVRRQGAGQAPGRGPEPGAAGAVPPFVLVRGLLRGISTRHRGRASDFRPQGRAAATTRRRGQQPGEPGERLHPHHRRDEPCQPGKGVR